MCYRHNDRKLTASGVGHGIFYFLVCCCIAATLSLVVEAVSARPSLEAQQILAASARLVGR